MVVIIRMQGEPAAAEAGVTLQQPEVHLVFSWGSCPWIMGPWQWHAAQAPRRECMDSDLCLHTGGTQVDSWWHWQQSKCFIPISGV